MTDKILLLPILLPLVAGILVFVALKKFRIFGEAILLATTFVGLLAAIGLFKSKLIFSLPWVGFGLEFSLRLYHFSAFILLAVAGFAFLLALYSLVFMRDKPAANQFYLYFLLTVAFTNGAVLADNLVLLLFFWEGLLLTLFGMIYVGHPEAFKTATKAFIIVGITDLCMMLGVILTGYLAKTLTMSQIHIPVGGWGSLAFILLAIGAVSKAGSMPFHSWIPDAALDAPLPFMALVPAALEKLLGIYFLARVSLDLFILVPSSWLSTLMMILGVVTIILAVMMALIQKNYKKLLSYHAISQVGYMILGLGTAVPAGIVGGLFHMINHALYKSGLFLTAGSVEKQAGTTELARLGGIASRMPVTFVCFAITAMAISGVPPFNGFFSKELVYDGALERGWIFYALAVLGSFFTAASFLKLGHAVFLGKSREVINKVKEPSFFMLLPMIVIALLCVIFGIFNFLPLHYLIEPVVGAARLEGRNFAGFPANIFLTIVSLIVLAAALLNHRFGVKRGKNALAAADHIHYAPVLSAVYDKAERGRFDPYNIGLALVNKIALVAFWCDRAVDWFYDGFVANFSVAVAVGLRRLHTGNYARYLVWSLAGLILMTVFLLLTV